VHPLPCLDFDLFHGNILTMRYAFSFGAILASTCLLVSAAPATDSLKINAGLRLIKTSETESVWVTEEEKIDNYVTKNIKFIDVTDIKVSCTS